LIDQYHCDDDGDQREHDRIKAPSPPRKERILTLVLPAFAVVELIVFEFRRNLVLQRMYVVVLPLYVGSHLTGP
jgi:hypothetical protein